MTFLYVSSSSKEIRAGTSLHGADSGQSCSRCIRDCLHPHRSTLTLSSKYCMNYMCRVSCSQLTTADKDRCSSSAQGPAKYSCSRWPWSLLSVYVSNTWKLPKQHDSQSFRFTQSGDSSIWCVWEALLPSLTQVKSQQLTATGRQWQSFKNDKWVSTKSIC